MSLKKGVVLAVTAVISVLMLSIFAFPLSASAQAPDFIPGRYIVVLDDGISPQDVIRGHVRPAAVTSVTVVV